VSYPPIPERARLIDETNSGDYYYIQPGDCCSYIWERMSKVRKGEWDQYPANSLIANLQIPMSCKDGNPDRFGYKKPAALYAAKAAGKFLQEYRNSTFVPVPPSKIKGDPDHDPRLEYLLRRVQPTLPDVRELVLQTSSLDSKQKGYTPEERAQYYTIDETTAEPEPTVIVVFDDVLTTGSHFKAMEIVLSKRFPDALILGFFLARAVRPPEETSSFWSE
jgi:hypothetical protein